MKAEKEIKRYTEIGIREVIHPSPSYPGNSP
jgi:hypothetical protein